MAITKTPRTLLASQQLLAGASIPAAELDLRTTAGAKIFVKITNGNPAPTTAPTVTFFSGEATGVKRQEHVRTGDTVAGSVANDISFTYGLRAMFANVTIQNGATNPITVEVFAQEATTV